VSGFEEAPQRLIAAFEAHRDAARAASMAKYMRDQFPFVGIATPERRKVQREALAGLEKPDQETLDGVVERLWEMPEREYQYAALELLGKHVKALDSSFVDRLEWLVVTKSWWDTVDTLASHIAGPLVLAHPALAGVMDEWIESDNFWLARTAILHQLGYKQRTDSERLFRYCARRAGEREFFIRKAMGWALREYSKTDPDAVRAFVDAHGELSPLTRREALAWVGRGRLT
jgi:3-methyladenine DNA glycosylase AlkD